MHENSYAVRQRTASNLLGSPYSWMVVAILFCLSTGCSSVKDPLRTVSHVDLPRYMGDWYVIANIPYFAEKNCYDSIESYALRPDGAIDNWLDRKSVV